MFLENEFNYFISTRNNLELVIDSLVLMIPDREFYYPEIQTGELRDYQIDIYDLIIYCRIFWLIKGNWFVKSSK